MKIILFMAMSVNGQIADQQGKEDFLSVANWRTFKQLIAEHHCFIVGRKTYQAVQKWPKYNFDNINADLKIIISKKTILNVLSPYIIARSPEQALAIIKQAKLKSVILTGGSLINMSFSKKA